MKALLKGPKDKGFREIIIPNKLETLQQLVGGYIESVTIAEDACILCNEEGRIRGMEHNCKYLGIDFCGPILIVGTAGEDFSDAPMSVTMANGGIEKGA